MGARCFLEQKWLIDAVIAAVGLDWDGWLRRVAPAGFEGMGDWAAISKQVRRYDETTLSFAEFAERRETRGKNALAAGDIESGRVASKPLADPSEDRFGRDRTAVVSSN
ncbi:MULTISPECIES: hypothetical protein [Bradyrhizobium]|uniref:Uncharacterized protein n=2 Tax=Bradyrhizobium TaxID=374 RepID=A0ABY0PEQ3_9BRAD|nr:MULTISPECIES: hypothetical protein [Bradyrhizobium]SDI19309.1 hypothetical protein SAMN05444163_2135 [Bradyrhizobium ottawaense]SED75129.1 hypothetical protein SAMN05444171_5035 [Bradyrhizobium lablabi]SHL70733.1 hypothetical protein SAMN05444321_3825 [Bradyrhizobium lablabi]